MSESVRCRHGPATIVSGGDACADAFSDGDIGEQFSHHSVAHGKGSRPTSTRIRGGNTQRHGRITTIDEWGRLKTQVVGIRAILRFR